MAELEKMQRDLAVQALYARLCCHDEHLHGPAEPAPSAASCQLPDGLPVGVMATSSGGSWLTSSWCTSVV